MLAAAGVVTTHAVSGADPASHQVTYTLTAAGPSDFTVTYLTAQPASKAAYNADSYAYMKREAISAGPEPLYGIIAMSIPAMDLNSSAARCAEPPVPADAKLMCPGFARA